MKIGVAITASFCTLQKAIENLKKLVDLGHDVYPIISQNIRKYDTRFGNSQQFITQIEEITHKRVIDNIVDAENFGPKNKMDIMVVLPATGDFIAKFANGITDNSVNLAIKATLRNQSPIVIAISTNDGLGINGENIMKLLNMKNVYFVPFGQDNYIEKPNSLVAHYDLLLQTIEEAMKGRQIQPVLLDYHKKN